MIVQCSEPDNDWVVALVSRAYIEHFSPMEFGAALRNRMNTRGCTPHQIRQLATTLIRFATASSVPENRLLQCLESLVKSEVLRWATFIEVITVFRTFSRVQCVVSLATILMNSVPLLRCSYRSLEECTELTSAIMKVLNWCLLALENSLKCENDKSTQSLIQCLSSYANDKFCRAVLLLQEQIGGDVSFYDAEGVNYIVEAAVSFTRNFPHVKGLNEMTSALRQFGTSPVERIPDPLEGLIIQAHPAILTLVSVFEGFRMTKKVDQMADSFYRMAEILGFPFAKMFEDMIRGSLLIILEAKEALGEELVASQAFFYVKLPQIFKHLLILGASPPDLLTALETICDNRTLLNQVEMKTKNNTFQHLLEQMAAAGVIDETTVRTMLDKRAESLMIHNPDILQMLGNNSAQTLRQPLILRANSAKMAVDKMLRQSNDERTAIERTINLLLKLASGSGGLVTFDSVCASFCADGNLTFFSSKLAVINGQSERPIDNIDMNDGRRQRALAFNLSFILLTRMRFIYNDLRPSELVNGSCRSVDNTQSCFFKFASHYGWTATESGVPSRSLTDEEKAPYMESVNILKHGQAFWDTRSVDYAELVDAVPFFGEILLDEFKIAKPENHDHLNESIKNVLHAFRDDANFMIVCLVQWMCAQPVTNARQSLVKSFIYALEYPHQLNSIQQERWALTTAACRRTLDDLSICDRLRDPRYTWVINCGKRKLPTVPATIPATRAQSSDAEMLKQAFTYARQQSWGSPNVLQLVDRCNKAGVVENWCMVWLRAMLKLSTNDEMVAAGELCLAAGMMSPVPCMLSFAQHLTDYILEQNVEFGSVEPKSLVSARFLVHCLQLALHCFWRQQNERRARGLKVDEVERKRPRLDGEEENINEANPVERSIRVIFEKFLCETRAGHLKSTITFIFHFMESLAAAPRNKPTLRIIELIPYELIINLARLDPQAFSIDIYFPLVDLNSVANAERALQFTCLLRRLGGI
ncbi:hypothetical protein AB6A40_004866 [Gnathostoma spinigerum]|uniref:Mediator of RNA polymerase II transcription subunit 24 n=1 Tax=Gnathostoma spinigerum TaxID=75299 RepID=A0ABD6ENN4_9BILA